MIDYLDHLVLTTAHTAACITFYTRVLGMRLETQSSGTPPVERQTLKFGQQTLNLQQKGREFESGANTTAPGGLNLCFIADRPLAAVIERLNAMSWPILSGPVLRSGAKGTIQSVYVRDPDLNLIEISEYLAPDVVTAPSAAA